MRNYIKDVCKIFILSLSVLFFLISCSKGGEEEIKTVNTPVFSIVGGVYNNSFDVEMKYSS